jgi:hypothetical protein
LSKQNLPETVVPSAPTLDVVEPTATVWRVDNGGLLVMLRLLDRVGDWQAPADHVRDIERPHDLEALARGQDLVVYLEPLTVRLPGEIAAMSMEPPLASAVPLPPSEANASSTLTAA